MRRFCFLLMMLFLLVLVGCKSGGSTRDATAFPTSHSAGR